MTFCSFNHLLEPKDVSESWFQQRAFQFGDGHFTTAKVEQGKVIWWSRHLQRLQQANEKLGIADIEWQQLSYVCQTISKPIENGYIKIQISRGEGVRGYQVSPDMKPLVFITANELALSPIMEVNQPVNAVVLKTQLGINPSLAGLKHTNRIEQSLIQLELNQLGQTEGLVTDIDRYLVESSKGNVFWLHNKQWYTPKLDRAGIDGVFRQFLLEQNPQILPVRVKVPEVIGACDAMFVTNAITGVTPITELQYIDETAQTTMSHKLTADLTIDMISQLGLSMGAYSD